MQIRTRLHEKPGPLRQFDWEAWLDGHEPTDDGQMGYGRSADEAITDLQRHLVSTAQLQIETSHWPQPQGWESHAWTAWYADEEPDDIGGMNFGYGSTRERATADLLRRFPRDDDLAFIKGEWFPPDESNR